MSNLRVGDAISGAFALVFKNLGTYLGTQGVIVLIAAAMSLFYTLTIGTAGFSELSAAVENQDMDAIWASLGPIIAGSFVFMIVSVVLSTLSLSMGIVVTDALHSGERLTFGDAWSRATPRFGNLLGTTLLIGLAIMGVMIAGLALFFLIVPIFVAFGFAIYLFARWALSAVVSVLERHSVTENIKRSTELTVGARGTILGAFIILALLISIPLGLATIPATLSTISDLEATGTPPTPAMGYQIFTWAINTVGQLAGAFLMTAFVVIAYRTLKPPAMPDEPAVPTPLGFDPVPDDA